MFPVGDLEQEEVWDISCILHIIHDFCVCVEVDWWRSVTSLVFFSILDRNIGWLHAWLDNLKPSGLISGSQTVHSVHFYVAFSEGETFCHSPKRLLQSQLLHNDWNLVLVSVIVQSYTVYKVGGKPAVSCDWDETSRWTEWTFWENICNFSIIHRPPLKYIFIAWSYCCIGDLWDNVVAVKLRCVETVPIWVWPSFCKQW